MSTSKYQNNKKQSVLVLGYGSIKKINNTERHVEQSYTSDFTSDNSKIVCLSLHYNGSDSFLFVNGKKICQFKAKDSEIDKHPIATENIANNGDLSDDDIESAKLYGNVYDFSVSYEQISNENILNIHNYLMRKMVLYKCAIVLK